VTRGSLREQAAPLDPACDCFTCTHFSAAYVHHLFKAEELLAYRLASIHNLRYMARLSSRMRRAILGGRFAAWQREFLAGYRVADEATRQAQREKRLAAWTATRPALDGVAGAREGPPRDGMIGGGGSPAAEDDEDDEAAARREGTRDGAAV
jgi:hypothetical protein